MRVEITIGFIAIIVGVTVAVDMFNTDNINVFLSNSNFVSKQLRCVLGKDFCDVTGTQLKMAIPEVLQRNCRSCTPQQAANAKKIIAFIRQKYPTEWSQIQSRYRG